MIRTIFKYFLLVSGFLFLFRYLHYEGLLRQKQGYYGKLNHILQKHNSYNTLFLGSSRAEMHYDIACIDSLTAWNSYNVSMAGASPSMAFRVLKLYLQTSDCPKRIFYEVDINRLKQGFSEIYNFNTYFPYLRYTSIRNELSKIDSRMQYFYLNPFYSLPYTGLKNLSTGLHGWLNLPTASDGLYYKGFIKDTVNTYFEIATAPPEFVYLSKHNRDYLDSIIVLSRSKGIELYLVTSPLFAGGKLDMSNKEIVVKQLETLAKKNKVPYWNLSSLSFCNQRDLFVDPLHLNGRGAQLFSRYFVDYFNTKSNGFALK